MTRTLLTIAFVFMLVSGHAQDAKEYYEKGLEMARLGKAEEAIHFFDMSIVMKSDEYVAWYNRGIAKVMAHRYKDALPDFDQAIALSPMYKKAYLNRGIARKHLTDYEGAMADYNYVFKLDTVNPEAYYYRGMLYNLLGKRIEACLDFDMARRQGYKDAKIEMESCVRRPIADDTSIHSILRLTRTSDSDSYGFTPEHPVRVGRGPESGPDNVLTYLDLLRDAKGRPLKYERVGPCCPYRSGHAFFGNEALEEKYEVSYSTADGSPKKTFVYLTFYDYDEPLILAGMKTVAPPK